MMRSVLIVALVIGLAACGRKGMPDWPEGAVYPRDYPYTPQPEKPKADKDSSTPELNTKAGY